MPKAQSVSLSEIADYHKDTAASLRFYFSPAHPEYAVRFVGVFPSVVAAARDERIAETEMRSSLVLMACIEAAFRIDYKERATRKKPDPISVEFRRLFKEHGERVRLDEDIWETWRANVDDVSAKVLISRLRSVFKFRHWLAHGRYWPVGNKYDFQTIYLLADTVLENFPFFG